MSPRPRNAQSLESRCTRGIQSYRCRVCNGIHALKKCRRFLRLSAEKRLQAVLVNRYCSSCLAHEHSDGSCRRGDGCKTCGQDHHTLLHPVTEEHRSRSAGDSKRGVSLSRWPSSANSRRGSGTSRPSSAIFWHSQTDPRLSTSRRSSATPRHSSALSRQSSSAPLLSSATHRVPSTARPPASSAPRQFSASLRGPPQDAVAAPTLSLPLNRNSANTGTRIFDTGAFIDPCTPSSCNTNLLGIGQSAVSARHVVQATIHSRTQAFQLEAELIVLKSISSSQPERAVQVLDWNLPDNIKLADPLFHKPQRIDILLGADAFFELLKEGKFKQETYGPVLQNSVFGWIVSGRCKSS
ncbi:hypothetical protein KR074_002539, partial [Drosophila pseudoananassae]